MKFDPARALQLLRIGSGQPTAVFRDGQEEAIRHVVEGLGRLLVVQKTGWGKSMVYFLGTRLLRDQGKGLTLLVSPLLSLMRNQIMAANRIGILAETINSSNTDDWQCRGVFKSGILGASKSGQCHVFSEVGRQTLRQVACACLGVR